jgi:hypothetical protein
MDHHEADLLRRPRKQPLLRLAESEDGNQRRQWWIADSHIYQVFLRQPIYTLKVGLDDIGC